MRRDVDVERNVASYLGSRRPVDRYLSFDYCFNYFQGHREAGTAAQLSSPQWLETSCLQLGFYLASWGMYRGSTVLLQRSLAYLVPVVDAVATAPEEIWQVDANDYSDTACEVILDVAERFRRAFPDGATDTLVTKTLLGVFGCVPAFDAYFRTGARLSTFGRRALRQLGDFYAENAPVIEWGRVATLDFATGRPTARRYSRAKVIDMVFFVEGGGQ